MNQRLIYVRGVSILKLDIVCGNQYGFSYIGGYLVEYDVGFQYLKLMLIIGLREMSLEEVELKWMWIRFVINVFSFDLSVLIFGRSIYYFYFYGSLVFNYL